mgnify:CR=1 FL=1
MKVAPGLFCLILYHFGLLAGQVVDDLACDDKPGHGGDVGGAARRWVHLRAVPGGQMQCWLQLMAISSTGVMAFSLE